VGLGGGGKFETLGSNLSHGTPLGGR